MLKLPVEDGTGHPGAGGDGAATAAPGDTRSAFSPRAIVRGLAWDVGLPLVVYYGLYLTGVGDWVALLGATLAAGARIGWVAMRSRELNPFSMVLLVVFGIGLALAFVTGDPRTLLLKSSIVTATVGITFLVSATWGRRPLTLAAEQHWTPTRAVEIAEEYRTDPDVRRGHRISSGVWGLGLLTEALVRVPVVYLLPISVVVALSTLMTLATLVGLIVWNVLYVARARRRVQPSRR